MDAPRLVRFGREPDPAGVGGHVLDAGPWADAWNRSPTIFGESGTTRSSGPGVVEALSVRRAPAITVARSRGDAHPHPGEAGLRRRGVARRVRACVSIGKPPRWVSAVTVHGLRGQSVSPPPPGSSGPCRRGVPVCRWRPVEQFEALLDEDLWVTGRGRPGAGLEAPRPRLRTSGAELQTGPPRGRALNSTATSLHPLLEHALEHAQW